MMGCADECFGSVQCYMAMASEPVADVGWLYRCRAVRETTWEAGNVLLR